MSGTNNFENNRKATQPFQNIHQFQTKTLKNPKPAPSPITHLRSSFLFKNVWNLFLGRALEKFEAFANARLASMEVPCESERRFCKYYTYYRGQLMSSWGKHQNIESSITSQKWYHLTCCGKALWCPLLHIPTVREPIESFARKINHTYV